MNGSDGPTAEHRVLGVDVGTTAVKVGRYRGDGTEEVVASREYPLDAPHPGWAEQDAATIRAATHEAIAEAADGTDVAGVALSVPMHALIGVDADGEAITPVVTYADTRARADAVELREEHLDVYRRTGTPLHPMAPLAKLRWFAREQPKTTGRVARWASLKDWLTEGLTGEAVIDHSTASATGLFDLRSRTWDPGALELAGIGEDRLPRLVPTDAVIDHLTDAAAAATGLPTATPVVVGATDGVLANLGVGAVATGGLGAVSIGTSGAVRVTVEEPRTDDAMRTFCYALTEDRWVAGGAISNGGLWLRWLRDQVFDGALDEEGLTGLAADVTAGADGVLTLPYLTGERAPQWSAAPSGVVFGLRFEHGRGHLVRAGLEGVAHQLRLVTDALADTGARPTSLRATGGFTRSDLWLRIVADVLDVPLELPEIAEAVAFGAAGLGMHALGMLDGLDELAERVRITREVEPDPEVRAVHDEAHRRYADLVDRLAPAFRAVAEAQEG